MSIYSKDDGADKIVAALYKRDPLSAVSHLFNDFSSLLETKRGKNESYKNFESRFSAQMSRYNAHGKSIELPESIVALLLLNKADVGDSQRVPILSAASSKASASVTSTTSNDDMIKEITYESIAAVIRQCDNGSSTSRQPTSSNNVLSTNSVLSQNQSSSQSGSTYSKKKRTMNPEQLRKYKLRCRCNTCGKFGHFHSDHNADGTIKDGLPSNDNPPNASNNSNNINRNGNGGAVLNFGMANLTPKSTTSLSSFSNVPSQLGPMVDSGAPYSAIGVPELCVLWSSLGRQHITEYDPIPSAISHYAFWQYGSGAHSSAPRRILGSVVLTCYTDSKRPICIRHLVIEGSSQWLIGRNVTSHCNQLRINDNRIQLPKFDHHQDYLSIVESDTHDYIALDRFVQQDSSSTTSARSVVSLAGNSVCVSESTSKQLKGRSLSDITRIVNRVHDHVCGHSSYGDIRTLLQRNQLWNEDVQKYLSSIVERCPNCIASSSPPSNRKVSISGINRQFNDVVCVDHFWLDGQCMFHIMDSFSRFSVAQPVESTALVDTTIIFESMWISQFWPPGSVQGDLAFQHDQFQAFLTMYGIDFRPVAPRRHHKNLLEPKHGVIRAIFLRLRNASPNSDIKLHAVTAVRISNEMYGTDTLSSFEIAKGYTKPVDNTILPQSTPQELLDAHHELKAKRKLTLMLRSQVSKDICVNAGDLVQVYIQKDKEKKGKWSSPRTVLKIDKDSGIVTVPGSTGRPSSFAVEDVRLAVIDDDFAKHISETNDQLSDILEDALEAAVQAENSDNITNEVSTEYVPDFDHDGEPVSSPSVGDRVEVYWPVDDMYYPGVVGEITTDGNHVVNYDDGDSETLELTNEQWRHANALSANVTQFNHLESEQPEILRKLMETFGNKPFLLHHAQGFPQYIIFIVLTNKRKPSSSSMLRK